MIRETISEWWWKHGDNILAHIPLATFTAILVLAYIADHV